MPDSHQSRARWAVVAAAIATAVASAGPAAAQQSDAELAKQLANPIASLISVPLQFNWNTGYGVEDADQAYVNIQPVIPITLSPEWNLISRTILPLIHQEATTPGGSGAEGIGDITQSLFFSPSQPVNGITWGVGPVFLLPTASESALGTEQWGAGPTGVVLTQRGPWTVGGLANHIWSFAGDDDREDVNQTFLQPFLTYTTPTATSFFLNTESTYDWEAEQWSVPINFGVNQLVKIGRQRVQLGAGARYWAEAPDDGPEGWGARVNVVFLFPR